MYMNCKYCMYIYVDTIGTAFVTKIVVNSYLSIILIHSYICIFLLVFLSFVIFNLLN